MSQSPMFNKFRKFALDFPERARELVLTKNEVTVLNLISGYTRANPFHSRDMDIIGTSPQSRSAIFNKLWTKGYLQRKSVNAPSGGYEYQYWVTEGLFDADV